MTLIEIAARLAEPGEWITSATPGMGEFPSFGTIETTHGFHIMHVLSGEMIERGLPVPMGKLHIDTTEALKLFETSFPGRDYTLSRKGDGHHFESGGCVAFHSQHAALAIYRAICIEVGQAPGHAV